jgi:large subunit ribosomal protein L27
MAHKKASGTTRQHAQRPGKRLGIKIYGGESIKKGQIIAKQRGSIFHPGDNVGMGRDHTLFALKDGIVQYKHRLGKKIIAVN